MVYFHYHKNIVIHKDTYMIMEQATVQILILVVWWILRKYLGDRAPTGTDESEVQVTVKHEFSETFERK